MGLQSLMFYTLITWLPDILQLHRYSPSSAGWMLFLMQAFLIPVTFIVPIYAERMKEQRFLGGIVASMFILGILGVLSGYTVVIPIAIIILGMACGAALDRKSTRLNSSHVANSYAVFCLIKKTNAIYSQEKKEREVM